MYTWNFTNFFIPFYVNAFFFITGYFIFKKQLYSPTSQENFRAYMGSGAKRYLSNLLLTLVLPCVVFSAIFYFPKVILGSEAFSVSGMINDTVGGGTYWFVSALVVAYLILFVPLVFRIKNIWYYFILACMCAAAGYYLAVTVKHEWTLWSYRQGMIALLYVVSGGLFYKYEKTIVKCINIYSASVLFAFYLYSVYFMHPMTLTSMCQINILGYFTSVISIVLLIYISRKMPENKLMSFIGQNSILFYFFSGGFPLIASIIVRRLLSCHNIICLCIVFALSLVMALALTYIVKRYFPYLKDFRKFKIA